VYAPLASPSFTGNVGIGTSSPAYKFDLYTTDQFSGRWGNATRAGYLYTDSGGPGIFNTAAYGGEGIYLHRGAGYIQFIANSVESMRLTASGNLGIGTTNPSVKFQTVQTIADWTGDFKNYTAGAYGLRVDLSGSSGAQAALQVYTAAGQGIIVKNDGLVGIGTFVPANKFTVADNSASAMIYGTQSGSGDLFAVANGSTEKFRITNAGAIGVGGANYGTTGQVLTSQGSGSAPIWSTASGGGASAATPTALGTVYGKTLDTAVTTALGYQSAASSTSNGTTSIGYQALFNQTSGSTVNTAVGYQAGYS